MHLLAILLAFAALVLGASADLCGLGAAEIDGNWFCQAVKAIQYSNVGTPGSYNSVIHMGDDGTCKTQPKLFSGPNAPLDGEVSIHIRGPAALKEFAVYAPARQDHAAKKEEVHEHYHHQRHVPVHGHGHSKIHPRQEVTATINGQVVSWGNNYWGTSTIPASEVMVTATIDGKVVSWENNWLGPSAVGSSLASSIMAPSTTTSSLVVAPTMPIDTPTIISTTSSTTTTSYHTVALSASPVAEDMGAVDGGHIHTRSTQTMEHAAPSSFMTSFVSTQLASATSMSTSISMSTSSSSTSTSTAKAATSSNTIKGPPSGPGFGPGDTFQRISHYHAGSQTADNIAFLGNHGGQGSGVFDYYFGASLAYAKSDARGGSASPQILADTLIPSGEEIVIMRGDKCVGGDCGYFRPGSVAHHGFDGADKIFLFEFSMPSDGKKGFEGDMPAIWLLNAEIPRAAQYGDCSCWSTGCGEFDIAEALSDGSTFLKSTLHTNTPAGDSDYLARPTKGTMKLAVIFSSATSTIHIQVLEDNVEFTATMSAEQVNGMCDTGSERVSQFAVSG